VAREKIMAEWASGDSLDRRLGFLTQGGGQNGAVVLNNATVLDNGLPNILTGGGHDWFFAHLGFGQDTITDFDAAKDHLTAI
jgi:hypothetical protein